MRIDGLGVVLLLAVERPEKVVRVGIGGIDFQNSQKISDRLCRLTVAAMHQSEVVPDPRIIWLLGRRQLQGGFRFRKLLLVQQRDTLVQSSGCQRWIEFVGSIK